MTLSSIILDALFPDSCLCCLAPREQSWRHEVACDECIEGVATPSSFHCSSCGRACSTLLLSCHPEATPTLALSPLHSRTVGSLSTALLHEGLSRAANPLADLLATACTLAGVPLHRAVVAPLPESPAATRERGYDANALAAQKLAELLDTDYAPQLFAVTPAGQRQVLGLGAHADAAAAELALLVGVRTPDLRRLEQLASLASAACPHARVLLLTCTA